VPLIYYGDEMGLPGAADPDNRRPMRFGNDLNPREQPCSPTCARWAAAHVATAGCSAARRRSLHTDGDGYVYARGRGPTSPSWRSTAAPRPAR
jgi:glycosidase